jgi:hypothetical protein
MRAVSSLTCSLHVYMPMPHRNVGSGKDARRQVWYLLGSWGIGRELAVLAKAGQKRHMRDVVATVVCVVVQPVICVSICIYNIYVLCWSPR